MTTSAHVPLPPPARLTRAYRPPDPGERERQITRTEAWNAAPVCDGGMLRQRLISLGLIVPAGRDCPTRSAVLENWPTLRLDRIGKDEAARRLRMTPAELEEEWRARRASREAEES